MFAHSIIQRCCQRGEATRSIGFRLLSTANVEVPPGTPPAIAALLPFIACPLTKSPLRYDPASRRLVNDELGVSYGVSDTGVPQLLPLLGQMLDEPAQLQLQQHQQQQAGAGVGQQQESAGGRKLSPR
ncbi:hypothetical protein HYH02_004977 [Chlamydomonas schloesseri]|uniref:Protein preY, mitochondrial n=1 Tax=Chlamydomonas schloesseri TaxID=2026947 RepID=A0A835WN23_9CHLO|nr:hypothetical protein HYH02_004977 [Chlamydomonas schloesseri]|eukprot:KAG2450476.1 hypothetical protein HYH02_004977 [Chlamydomonas schloesseri]